MITLSVIKADIGGYVGHSSSHPLVMEKANERLDKARRTANDVADYMRSHGPFKPHRLPLEEMEYTTMPQVMRKLEGRFVDL